MSNQKNQNQEVAQEQQVQQAPVQAEPAPVTVAAPQQVQTTAGGGFGTWLKRHWKGVVAAVTGAAAVGGSAVVAYKKGKAAGIMSVPQQQETEDYSLNPNN